MKLSTGKEAFDLEFDEGTETIYFNPNDPDLGVRMCDFEKNVSARIESLDDIELNSDGTPKEGGAAVEQVRSILNMVREEIDRAFNSKISDKVFKYCSPFAIVNGDYFILQFIDAIKPEIESRISAANTAANDAINSRLAKYGK